MRLDTRKNIGNAGLAMAIAYFGSNGYTVSIPLNDTQDYDLVVDMDGVLKKVQVKSTNSLTRDGAYALPLKSTSGTTRKQYKTVKDTDVDLLFCLCGGRLMFLIPVSEIRNTSVLSLREEASKYSCAKTDYTRYRVYM